MVHHGIVQNYSGTGEELAEDIGNLRYDALAEFLRLLAAKIAQDGQKDAGRGRSQLASALQDTAAELAAASEHMKRAWQIAKPFMPSQETMR